MPPITEQVLSLFAVFGGVGAVAFGIGFAVGVLFRVFDKTIGSTSSLDD